MFDLSERTERTETGYGVRGIIPIETGSTCYGPNTVAFKVRHSLLQYIIHMVRKHVC